jgi:hypothetical protein
MAAEAGLPEHFSHGIPALGRRDGQIRAWLSGVLITEGGGCSIAGEGAHLPRRLVGGVSPAGWPLPRTALVTSTCRDRLNAPLSTYAVDVCRTLSEPCGKGRCDPGSEVLVLGSVNNH